MTMANHSRQPRPSSALRKVERSWVGLAAFNRSARSATAMTSRDSRTLWRISKIMIWVSWILFVWVTMSTYSPRGEIMVYLTLQTVCAVVGLVAFASMEQPARKSHRAAAVWAIGSLLTVVVFGFFPQIIDGLLRLQDTL